MPESPSSNPQALSLPVALRAQLEGLRAGIWRTRFFEWSGLSLSLVLLAYLAVWISDRLWDTPSAGRFALFTGVVITIVIAASWAACRWGMGLGRWDALGRFVRRWNRRSGDRVLAAIELSSPQSQTLKSESPSLREAAIRQLGDQLGQVNLMDSINPTRLQRRSSTAVSLVLFVGLLLLLAPQAGINAALRCFTPWKDVERYTFVQLDAPPESRLVPHGEPSTFTLSLTPYSRWKRSQASARFLRSGQRLSALLEDGHYHFSLPGVVAEERIAFKVGDAEHTLRLIPKHRPGLKSLVASVELPDYLQHPPREVEIMNGRLEAVRGSQLILHGSVTRPLAEVELRGLDIQALQVTGPAFRSPRLSLTEQPQVVEMDWVDHLGLTPKAPLRLQFTTFEDQPPRVEILADVPSPVTLLASDTIALALRAEDDFGMKNLGYVCGAATNQPQDLWRAQTETQSLAQGSPQAAVLDADVSFSPQDHGLEPGAWLVWAYAQDYRPSSPPAFSSPKTIQILTEEQHASLVRAQFRQVQERLESVARREADLMQQNEALAATAKLDPAAIERQRVTEEANAVNLKQLSEETQGLLDEAMKNQSLDLDALKPWSAMLGAMRSVAQEGMPQAAQSLSQAQGAASAGEAGRAKAALAAAIAQQEENLQQLAQAMGHGQATEEKLEAATFVNRLRQAAASEEDVATTMKASVYRSAGLTPEQLDPDGNRALDELAAGHEATCEEIDYLMSDLEHYHRRTEKAVYGEVHRQMVDAQVPLGLSEITRRVQGNQHGRVMQNALRWARQFHAWADALASKEADEDPPPQEGSGESQGEGDAEMMLALMRLVQREMTLRDQTRAADQRRNAPSYATSARKLAEEQRAIGLSVAQLIVRVLGPELQARLRAAAAAINDASELLQRPETGGETIAAETEVIELLANAARSSGQASGNSKTVQALEEMLVQMELGNSPGGNASGGRSALASANAEGATGQDKPEERRIENTRGFAGGDFPEEFREALGYFFEQREELREGESAP